MARQRRARKKIVEEIEASYELTRYAETAYRCADAVWRDAFDVREELGERKFKKIQGAAEVIIRNLGKYLPL